MLASSSAEVRPGKTETQQLRVMANPNVRSLPLVRVPYQLLIALRYIESDSTATEDRVHDWRDCSTRSNRFLVPGRVDGRMSYEMSGEE